MAAGAVTTIIALGLEAFQLGHAIKKEKDYKNELARMNRPFLKIQDEYFQNKNIAAEQAMSGLPAATKDALDSQRRKGLSTGISALLSSGVNPGDVGKLFQTYDDSVTADAARDAEARTRNIDYFINLNKEIAGQKTTQFTVNELAPYERKLKQLTQNLAIEGKNRNDALSSMAATVSSYGNIAGGMGGGGGAGKSGTSGGGGGSNVDTSSFTSTDILNNFGRNSSGDSSGDSFGSTRFSGGNNRDSSGGDNALTQEELNDIFKLIGERMNKR